MRARVIRQGDAEAGLPLTKTFYGHVRTITEAEARNADVQSRFGRLARESGKPGPALSFSGNEANPLFHNTAGRGFVEVGATLGISRREDSRGFVLVDLDQDGALDVVLHNYFKNPIVALLNRAAGTNRWVRVRLRGTKSNRFGIGARVTADGQVQEMVCGTGYVSGNPPELHYGLGAKEAVDLKVRWPSGQAEQYAGLKPGHVYTLVEGDPSAARAETPRPVAVEPDPAPAPAAEPDLREVLKDLKTLAGQPAPPGEGPLLVVFFSIHCYACVEELKRMGEVERRAKEAGHRVLWVTTDADTKLVGDEFRMNGAPSMPFRPGKPLAGVEVPCVYRVTPAAVEKYFGRHAVTAALASMK